MAVDEQGWTFFDTFMRFKVGERQVLVMKYWDSIVKERYNKILWYLTFPNSLYEKGPNHLSGQTFRLPGILTDLQVGGQKKKFKPLCLKRTSIYFQFMCLLFRLIHSSYYSVIFNILNRQKRDKTKLKFLWTVNMTGSSPKFILIEPWLQILTSVLIFTWIFEKSIK